MHRASATLDRPLAGAEVISLIGVDYLRFKTEEGGDLYLTRFGLPIRDWLRPENWYAPEWFNARRTRLQGTSTIYKIPTKPVGGVSRKLVARFSRVGQEIPYDATRSQNINAEFNSPFEEFALIVELRAASTRSHCPRIFTKKPLAIYVPLDKLRSWQTGRLDSKMSAKLAQHPEAKLDVLRGYVLLYGWIHGVNAVQAVQALGVTGCPHDFLSEMTLRAIDELQQHGFRVLDIKPEHIILRIRPDGSLLRQRDGKLAYALVDYELLERIEGAK